MEMGIKNTVPPSPGCEITGELMTLDGRAEELQKSIIALRERLEPVLASQPESEAKSVRESTTQSAECEVARKLCLFTELVRRLTDEVRNIESRCRI